MELLGRHHISFDQLRSAAIRCHALDLSAHHLFMDGTHLDGVEKTRHVYEELFTVELLALAISLRTKFYQGADSSKTAKYVSASGLLYKYKGTKEETISFSLKDVCDKIIHAERISRYLEPGIPKATTSIYGSNPIDRSTWELSISISMFCEAVLNWVHSIDR